MTRHTLTHHSVPAADRVVGVVRQSLKYPATAERYTGSVARVCRRTLLEMTRDDLNRVATDDADALAAMASRMTVVPTDDVAPDLARSIRTATAGTFVYLLQVTANRTRPPAPPKTPAPTSANTPAPVLGEDLPAHIAGDPMPTFYPLRPLSRLTAAEREQRAMRGTHSTDSSEYR